MDHVERLLDVRELRAIVCVVDSPTTGQARMPRGSSGSETLCELAVWWWGLLRSSGYLKEKARKEKGCGEPSELSEGWGRRVSAGRGRALYGERSLDYSK
jgi:hypothetical protein